MLYDFKCEQCFYKEEKLVTADTKDNEWRCPKCNGFMIRQFPHSNFYLKGRGWSNTNYSKTSNSSPTPFEND